MALLHVCSSMGGAMPECYLFCDPGSQLVAVSSHMWEGLPTVFALGRIAYCGCVPYHQPHHGPLCPAASDCAAACYMLFAVR